MARQPTPSADSVAQDQIKAFVDRILRMREEERAIKADIREIYAEAKASGHDKTVLGKVVNYVEKRSSKANELAEGEALFDLYLSAYDSASGRTGTVRATHAHEAGPWVPPSEAEVAAREARRRQRVSEDMDDHKALMDEIGAAGLLSPEQVAENKRLADAVATKFGNGPNSDHDHFADLNEKVPDHPQPRSEADLPATTGSETEPMAAQDGEAGPGATVAETAMVGTGLSATQSTAARKDVPPGRDEVMALAAESGKTSQPSGTQAPTVDTHPEPGSKGSGFVLDREVTASSPAPVIPFKHPDDGRPRSKEGLPRPIGCQKVDACAKTWRDTEPCSLCRRAIAVKAGGVETDYQGLVS